jgi:hypothetical protein
MATPGLINTSPGAQGLTGALGSGWDALKSGNIGGALSGLASGFGLGAAPQNTFDPYAQQLNLAQPGGNTMSSPVAAMMQARAMGQGGPSAADIQSRMGFDQARAAAASAAAESTNPALAHRQSIQAASGLTAEQANVAALLKKQEEEAAQQAYMQASLGQQGQAVGQQNASTAVAGQVAAGNQSAAEKSQGGLLAAGGALLGSIFSDRRLKHDIDEKRGGKEMARFLGALRASRYEYNDESHGSGGQYGVMAQDALKSEVGRTFVRETPEGLQLDGTRAIGPILAALAHLNSKIEG